MRDKITDGKLKSDEQCSKVRVPWIVRSKNDRSIDPLQVSQHEMIMFLKDENLQRMKDHSLGFSNSVSSRINLSIQQARDKPKKFRLGNANATRSVYINSGHCSILHIRSIYRCTDDYFASKPFETLNEYISDIFSPFHYLEYFCSSLHQALSQ